MSSLVGRGSAVVYAWNMANMLCLDFDDTVVLKDVAAQVLDRFAPPDWKELRLRRRAGELSLEQYSAAAIALISARKDEIVEFALSVAEPRGGLMELLDWAHWNDWQAAVVSNGWDLYIDPILAQLGADRVVRHCGRARFAYEWQLRYFSPRGVELADGFKVSYIASYRDQGDFVAFVGDGPSDVAAARIANTVFARDILWNELREEHGRIHFFESFHDVREVLEQESHEWLASFSSTTAAGA